MGPVLIGDSHGLKGVEDAGAEWLRTERQAFNHLSRYLKIRKLRIGFSHSRPVLMGTQQRWIDVT